MKHIAALLAALPVALPSLLFTLPALAHDGHGALTPFHWHASDTAGFITIAVLAGLALWLSRGE
jgi:hypothetical protein